jgi:hypothetical protein
MDGEESTTDYTDNTDKKNEIENFNFILSVLSV